MHQDSWSVAVFSSRESASTLVRTIRAIRTACANVDGAVIDVVVNGNRVLANEVAQALAVPEGGAVYALRVWDIALGDKAHAWNSYLHDIWNGAHAAFFVDGYARVRANALTMIAAGMQARSSVLAGSGVPTEGPSAAKLRARLLDEGGAHGNLYAIKGDTLSELKARNFRLPLGIYRTDPLLMSVISFNLDPLHNDWSKDRIYVAADATWSYDSPRWWVPRDMLSSMRRRLRQAQGLLETHAFRQHLAIDKRPFELFPATARDLVLTWVARHPNDVRRLMMRHPSTWIALRKLQSTADWSGAKLPPRLVLDLSRAPS